MTDQLPVLESLGRELERVAARDGRHGGRRRRRTVGLAVVAAVGVSAGALAASGVLTGEPVRDPGPPPTPTTFAGVVVKGSATLTGLRVADPGGGPAWGMRVARTTRALGCAQVGRIVDGRLGVLGQDGAFGDDRRFHPLGPDVQGQRECRRLDGAGRTFLAVSYNGLPASGEGGSCLPRAQPPRPAGLPAPTVAPPPVCPRGDTRIVLYGLLGPQARSVSYRDEAGTPRTAATSGPDGAYLVVLRPSAARPASGTFVPSSSPGSGLTGVTYRDGHTCRIPSPRALGGAKRCPTVGYVAPRHPPLSPAQVRTPVTLRVSRKPVLVPQGPTNEPSGPRNWKVTLSFTARVAATGRNSYVVVMTPRHSAGCRFTTAGPINEDVRAGRRAQQVQYFPTACHGPVDVVVRLHRPTSADDGIALFAATRDDLLVDRATVTIPRVR